MIAIAFNGDQKLSSLTFSPESVERTIITSRWTIRPHVPSVFEAEASSADPLLLPTHLQCPLTSGCCRLMLMSHRTKHVMLPLFTSHHKNTKRKITWKFSGNPSRLRWRAQIAFTAQNKWSFSSLFAFHSSNLICVRARAHRVPDKNTGAGTPSWANDGEYK